MGYKQKPLKIKRSYKKNLHVSGKLNTLLLICPYLFQTYLFIVEDE